VDITGEVGKRFDSAAAKADRRLSRQGKSQSKMRHGERQDPSERLMDKITQASRPVNLIKKPVTKPAPKAKAKDEPAILPVPKVSSNG
jgi:hypothetical protein